MAVSPIKKFYLVAPVADQPAILHRLADSGAVEILPLSEQQIQTIGQQARQELEIISQAIEASRHYCSDQKYIARLLLRPAEREKILSGFDWKGIAEKIRDLEKRIQEIDSKRRLLESQYQQLLPWENVTITLRDLRSARYIEVAAIGLNPAFHKDFLKVLETEISESVCGRVSGDKNLTYCWVIYPRSQANTWQKIRQQFSIQEFSFPEINLSPQRLLRWQKRRQVVFRQQLKQLNQQLSEIAENNINKLKVVYDYFYEQVQLLESERNFLRTSSCLALQGYIVEKFIPVLERALPETAIFLAVEPAPGENVPTVLANSKIIEPFEVVTDLYGRPAYTEMDPTGKLAPFFVLFFGICMADVLYGLILIAVGLIMGKKLASAFGQRFSRLIFYCGIFTAAFGLISGSWFSNLFTRVFPAGNFVSQFTLFDPLKNPAAFLLLTIVLGLIQTIYGTLLNIYNSWRMKDWPGLFLGAGPTLGVQLSFPAIIATYIFGVLPEVAGKLSLGLLGLSALLIMVNQWRINKEIVLKLFQMVFSVYSAITGNSLADPLSYCRLFALNLSTALLGTAINEIGMLFGAVPVLGPVIILVFLLAAHLINLLLGTLGAYVHTSRLQYLEFFNKFFSGGGRPMKVYSLDKKYTIVTQ